jgi:hypothetical protein
MLGIVKSAMIIVETIVNSRKAVMNARKAALVAATGLERQAHSD